MFWLCMSPAMSSDMEFCAGVAKAPVAVFAPCLCLRCCCVVMSAGCSAGSLSESMVYRARRRDFGRAEAVLRGSGRAGALVAGTTGPCEGSVGM